MIKFKVLTNNFIKRKWYNINIRVRSSVGLERMATNYKVGGSNPSGLNIRFLDFKKAINKHLVAIGVPEIAVINVPFTPAGELDDPRLPDREDWLTAFWIAAFKRINRNAKAAFLMANVDRISLSSTSGEGNEESKVRKDDNVCQSLTIEERNAIKESG